MSEANNKVRIGVKIYDFVNTKRFLYQPDRGSIPLNYNTLKIYIQ